MKLLRPTIQNDKLLPLLIYPYDKREKEYIPLDKNIRKFIAKRVVPQEREDIESILKRLDLKIYNPWIICKMSRGMCLEDYIWLAKPNEEFTELHMRYLMEHNKNDNVKRIFEIFQNQVKEAM